MYTRAVRIDRRQEVPGWYLSMPAVTLLIVRADLRPAFARVTA